MMWELHPLNGGWQLPIEQRTVSRCILDSAFVLEFHEIDEKAILRIEGAFLIRDNRGSHELTAAKPAGLGPALDLFGQVVRLAIASQEGRLKITFEDGRTLSVEPNDCYEAWEMNGPRGVRAVCTPGGAISVWQHGLANNDS